MQITKHNLQKSDNVETLKYNFHIWGQGKEDVKDIQNILFDEMVKTANEGWQLKVLILRRNQETRLTLYY